MVITARQIAFLLTSLSLLSACIPTESDVPGSGSEWDVNANTLHLEEDLRIADTDDFYFGNILGVAVDDAGRIFVGDGTEAHVKVLSPEGDLLETIGQRGEGPGDFQWPKQVYLGTNDTVYVYDEYTGRISVFEPESPHSFVRSIQLESVGPSYPSQVFLVPDEAFLTLYTIPMLPGTGEAESPPDVLTKIDIGETPADTVLVAPPREYIIDTEQGMAAIPVPFGRRTALMVNTDGQIYSGWTDSLGVAIHDLDGQQVDAISIPFERLEVTDEDVQRVLAEIRHPIEQRVARIREISAEHMPDTKPAFEQLLVDTSGRLWFERPTESPAEKDWWVVDADERQVHTIRLPAQTELLLIDEDVAYARTEGENGEPVLARYRIIE